MRHLGITTLAMVAFLSLSSFQIANAQPQPGVGPTRSPSFSPYLNLLRNNGGGGNAVTNYYGIIRPQQQLQQQSGMLQQQLSMQNQSIQGLSNGNGNGDNTVGPITGSGASFGFYSHYFNTLSPGGGGRAGASSGGRSGGMGMSGIGGGNIGQGPSQNLGNAVGGGGRARR